MRIWQVHVDFSVGMHEMEIVV